MRIRLMTYNIHRAIGLDRRFRPDRIVSIVEHYRPEVVLLQEVDSGVPRSREQDMAHELARDLSYPHMAVGHNVTLRRGRYGNATFSVYPIERERNIDLTIDGRKRRGCQHTTIVATKAPGHSHRFEVFNLHLGLSARERTRQIGILARSNELAALAADQSCLIGGDFNDWRGLLHPLLTEFMGFQCATASKTGYTKAIRTYPSLSPTGSLDKVYYRGGLRMLSARRCGLNVSRVASDHLPVIVDFELR